MIEFFDTTVLVAAMLEDGSRHELCAEALETAENGCVAAHSIAECYATLTGGKLGLQISAADAAQLIRHNLHKRVALVTLSAAEYFKLLDHTAPAGARGGAICDLFFWRAPARQRQSESTHSTYAILQPWLLIWRLRSSLPANNDRDVPGVVRGSVEIKRGQSPVSPTALRSTIGAGKAGLPMRVGIAAPALVTSCSADCVLNLAVTRTR